jgi:uncharacterized membrane protein (DUF441 family)
LGVPNFTEKGVMVGVLVMIIGMILHLVASEIHQHNMNDNMILAVHYLLAGMVYEIVRMNFL